MKLVLLKIHKLPLFIFAIPAVVVIRLIKPWFLVRWGTLISARIGHFATNTELYLCERDAGINMPMQRHMDIFLMGGAISNRQLAKMWKRILRVWPAWILSPIYRINGLIPGGAVHEVGDNTQGALDVHNLLDRFPPHLKFTSEEEARGETGLRAMGVPTGAPFICLVVRDSAYLAAHAPAADWSYHNYRDSDIQNYVQAAEELADRGYFVIRMGAVVKAPLSSCHPRVIDYATNGMRSDFMDIYLGAKCLFCISTGMGFDAIPIIFRKPIVSVNCVPVGDFTGFSQGTISIFKKHWLASEQRWLSLKEILTHGVGWCLHASGYESKGIRLIENTPEEICDVAIEMAERLSGTWQAHEDDEALQRKLCETFPVNGVDARWGRLLYGEIRARCGATFLRNNRWWLE